MLKNEPIESQVGKELLTSETIKFLTCYKLRILCL